MDWGGKREIVGMIGMIGWWNFGVKSRGGLCFD